MKTQEGSAHPTGEAGLCHLGVPREPPNHLGPKAETIKKGVLSHTSRTCLLSKAAWTSTVLGECYREDVCPGWGWTPRPSNIPSGPGIPSSRLEPGQEGGRGGIRVWGEGLGGVAEEEARPRPESWPPPCPWMSPHTPSPRSPTLTPSSTSRPRPF